MALDDELRRIQAARRERERYLGQIRDLTDRIAEDQQRVAVLQAELSRLDGVIRTRAIAARDEIADLARGRP